MSVHYPLVWRSAGRQRSKGRGRLSLYSRSMECQRTALQNITNCNSAQFR